MLAQKPRSLKSVIELVEENPRAWFPKFLDATANGDTDESYLLLQRIVDDLHPIASAECCRIARRRGGIYLQPRH